MICGTLKVDNMIAKLASDLVYISKHRLSMHRQIMKCWFLRTKL